jgi:hypothetical protein
MPWEPGQNHYTLLLQKLPLGRFKIYQFMRVKNKEGTEYLEPIPSESFQLRGFKFDAVEYFEHPGTRRGADATPLSLTAANVDESVFRTAG